jgi:hypothetical protein
MNYLQDFVDSRIETRGSRLEQPLEWRRQCCLRTIMLSPRLLQQADRRGGGPKRHRFVYSRRQIEAFNL